MTEQEAIDKLKNPPREAWKYGIADLKWDNALDIAIKAMEKKIPKKPIDDTAFGICPCCHTEFNSELVQEYNVKFCLNCGQAIDWRDEE